jgi:uncharacterized membrane protein YphA (DoxX/SURF4 family)
MIQRSAVRGVGVAGSSSHLFSEIIASLALLLRLALGGTFVLAGCTKLIQPRFFRDFVGQFVRRDSLVRTLPAVVGLGEIVLGTVMIAGIRTRLVATLTIVVLLGFSAILLVSLHQGRSTSCGCFGSLDERPISGTTLVRNALLGAAGLFILITNPAGVTSIQVLTGSAELVALLPLMTTELTVLMAVVVLRRFAILRARSLEPPPEREVNPLLAPAWYGTGGARHGTRRTWGGDG